MTENEYLLQILNKYATSQATNDYIVAKINSLLNDIKEWSNGCLEQIFISGSRAKGTAIKGSSDIDLLISLKTTTNNTLEEIYNSLYNKLVGKKYSIRKQNVSLGINYQGYNIDLVPAKKHSGNTNDHSLYCHKRNSWTKTNIQKHVNYVINSGRINEIKIIKIWAKLHNLDFPSIYLEHIVIEALKNKYKGNSYLGRNVMSVFEYICNNLQTVRIVDISNSNNIISDELNSNEKLKVINQAKMDIKQQYWENIIW